MRNVPKQRWQLGHCLSFACYRRCGPFAHSLGCLLLVLHFSGATPPRCYSVVNSVLSIAAAFAYEMLVITLCRCWMSHELRKICIKRNSDPLGIADGDGHQEHFLFPKTLPAQPVSFQSISRSHSQYLCRWERSQSCDIFPSILLSAHKYISTSVEVSCTRLLRIEVCFEYGIGQFGSTA